jgi:MarR family transcriptional regulator, organic hydroperoxide resistance regulator
MKPLLFLSPLHRASRQIALFLNAELTELGFSSRGGHVMSYLASYAPCTVGELSRVFGMNKSTLTGLLDRLVDQGLVKRTVNPEDRRSFVVDITAKGKSGALRLRTVLDTLERRISERITEAELAGFHEVMSAIAEVTQIEVRPGTDTRKRKEKQP